MHKNSGFTLIEIMILVIIIGILGTLVAMTYNGIQSKNRNAERQANIKTLQSQLEVYYAQTSQYPTLANLNNATWREKNLKSLEANTLHDPLWAKSVKECVSAGQPQLSSAPIAKCYSYQVTTPDGSLCNNTNAICAQYTLTATLEGGEKYVKSSLN